MPEALLVVFSPEAKHSLAVARSSIEGADGQSVIFLYLGRPQQREVRPFEIVDPYSHDPEAQETFRQVAALARRHGTPAHFVYRVSRSSTVLDVWRAIRPSEIIAEADIAKVISKQIAPEYVRFHQLDGIRIAHYRKHRTTQAGTPTGPAGANGSEGRSGDESRSRITPTGRPDPSARPSLSVTSKAAEPSEIPAQGGINLEDYVWTGTELVRRSDLSPENQPTEQPQEQPRGQSQTPSTDETKAPTPDERT